MKKLQVTISEEAHKQLLAVQFERKMKNNPRTTLIEVASDILNDKLIGLENGKAKS